VRSLAGLAPLVLTISGGLLYHVAAKSLPKTVEPLLVLVVAYGTALAVSVVAYVLSPPLAGPGPSTRPWHLALPLVGLGAVLIELGYVLAYRAAWPVSTASVLTNGVVAMLLVPIGILVFGDSLTIANLIGLALCVVGLALLR
jgi:multidrug transporter EmrE-like cation transporter